MASSTISRLPGFEHINTYFDSQHNIETAKLLPGDYYVTSSTEAVVTVLGSCVSACVRDRVFGIGGMNHFMLPIHEGDRNNWRGGVVDNITRFGNYAMEHLINDILSNGGMRKNLEVKVFGGGRIIKGMSDIGACNARFVLDYLKEEGLSVVSQDLNGDQPRKIYYFPKTGRVLMKKLASLHNDTLVKREEKYFNHIENAPVGGEVDLF
ncbi:MAG: chemoreceptor glutamine deamidase CheD [Mariprofundaceae bacterium]|nr:chemoreceptor glutamine deamidase CheD [Mariprofundaceae bacterium]